ncbi:hypothetical protein LOC67_02785 [Stieleria sp. JC731]|uniref:hypothetical protein n=1 Tax=Pirellulaceae TaxID=2691357 RepID=UPI001E2E96D8|nr:hypothetical protein [Stieleria sp. JC731]MCC9599472.1 hypothetical protein [Stieleria sp. JC731]
MRSTIEAEIDASTSRLIVVSPHREEFRLGDGVTIDQIRVPSQTPSSSLRRLKLRCSDQGVTPTYAIQLSCGKLSRWIGFVGVSGQVIDQLDDNEIVAVMSVE